jgi:8-oxo-dGTP pyrophosphatase MutT (NUDIX family)
MDDHPSTPVPAATVVVLRPGDAGIEALLVRRHSSSGFMGGATVFPGGKVDPEDGAAPASGRTSDDCARLLGMDDPVAARAFLVAAIRELSEEAGVLLARDAGGRVADEATTARVRAAIEGARTGRRIHASAWHELVRAAGLVPALDLVHPFARWVTPAFEPRRFDTVFLAAVAPADQVAMLDGHETTRLEWMRPSDAIAQHRADGDVQLPPPTLATLLSIAEHDAAGASAADDWIRAHAWISGGDVMDPVLFHDGDEPALALPGDPLHPRTTKPSPWIRHRFVLMPCGRFDLVEERRYS